MYYFLIMYFIITFGLIFYETYFYFSDVKRCIYKNKKLILNTLLFILIVNPFGALFMDIFMTQGRILYEPLIVELIKFIIATNLIDVISFVSHYLQHKYYYRFHKEHHKAIDTCMFFGHNLDFIDYLTLVFQFLITDYLVNLSVIGLYVFFAFTLFFAIYNHRLYKYNNKYNFIFHNYHHYSQKHNFSLGYPCTFAIMDRLFGTYKSV